MFYSVPVDTLIDKESSVASSGSLSKTILKIMFYSVTEDALIYKDSSAHYIVSNVLKVNKWQIFPCFNKISMANVSQ